MASFVPLEMESSVLSKSTMLNTTKRFWSAVTGSAVLFITSGAAAAVPLMASPNEAPVLNSSLTLVVSFSWLWSSIILPMKPAGIESPLSYLGSVPTMSVLPLSSRTYV